VLVRPVLVLLFVGVLAAQPAFAQADAGAAIVAADADAEDDVAPGDAGVADAAVVERTVPMTPMPPEYLDGEPTGPITTMGDVIVTFLKAMAALGAVLALAWLTLGKGIPKLVEKAQAGKRVKVVERIALDARRSLFLVDIDGRLVVLGGGDIVKLADLSDARPGRFAEVLSSTPPATPPSEKT